MNIVCTQFPDNMYLKYTAGLSQIWDGNRFITIIGEMHNMNIEPPNDRVDMLDQYQYVLGMGGLLEHTLLLLEIPESGPMIKSYNLNRLNELKNINTKIKSDFRADIFAVKDKPDLYHSIVYGNDDFFYLSYEEWVTVNKAIDGFYDHMQNLKEPHFPQSFKDYVGSFRKKFKKLKQEVIKKLVGNNSRATESDLKFNWSQFYTPSIKEEFTQIQMSILDIGMLFHMYRHPHPNVIMIVGDAHRRNLNEYFTNYVLNTPSNVGQILAQVMQDNKSNYVNLKGTFLYNNISDCIRQLSSTP